MPLTNAVGTNTAHNTRATAMTGPLTSFIAFFVASTGPRPRAMLRSTFSTTTMASSTTMPIASTRPNSERLFNEIRPHRIGSVDGVRSRQLPNNKRRGGLAAELRDNRVITRCKFHARHVADACYLALRPLLDDDVTELLLIEQTALRADRELK